MNIDTSPKAVAALVDRSLKLRINKKHHLGCGDVRLTIAQQDEILNTLEALAKERDENERAIRWFNDRVLGDGVIIDDLRARLQASAEQLATLLREHNQQLTAAQADSERLREMLAWCYCGPKLYADDGQLQDNTAQPFIDFRRDSVATIQESMTKRAFEAIAARNETKGTQ